MNFDLFSIPTVLEFSRVPCCSLTCLGVPYTFLMHYAIKILVLVVAEKSLCCLEQINLIIIVQHWNNSKI